MIAATNLPNLLDPALRRPGRFDREIAIPIPDRNGREEILSIHSRGMPLAEDVVMGHLAGITHGFVGADLEALCREAAMLCLRRIMPDIDFALARIPYEQLAKLEVRMEDFLDALREVEPSATREVFVEVPDVRWEDVGGLAQVKQRLIEAVEWPLQYAGTLHQGRHPSAEGNSSDGAAGLREDVARQGHRQRKQGQLHLREGTGAALQVRGRVGTGRARHVPQGQAGGARASSSSTRSTRWCRRAAPAAPTRTSPNAS